MEIDESLLERAPLSEYEKELIRLIDIQGVEVTKVALQKGKDKSTISIQHNRALEKLQNFIDKMNDKEFLGKLAGKIFAKLDKGKPLTKIVTEVKEDPEIIKLLYKQWLDLKEDDLNSPSVPNRIKQIEQELKKIHDRIDFLEDDIDDINSNCFTTGMYYQFKCSGCGSERLYAIRVKCTNCDKETWWGHFPKRG